MIEASSGQIAASLQIPSPDTPFVRLANQADIQAMLAIENRCFKSDRLSYRSFKQFVKAGSHELWVLIDKEQIIGYVLLLFRAGTSLARLYSLVLIPEARGQGLAKTLLTFSEQQAALRLCLFLRLEVNQQNTRAIQLYQAFGFKLIGERPHYYEDGGHAYKMEKRIISSLQRKPSLKPYYPQTTEFTCGPAALMMAMHTLDPQYAMTRHEELQIWREATTIFMTSGHGGCSPHGLALSAWRRGFQVKLFINTAQVPFEESVRSDEKKRVIRLVHQAFLKQMAQTEIELIVQPISDGTVDEILDSQQPVLALISTWRLNRNKAPHWVYVAASDETCFYINDPDKNEQPYLSQTDFENVPIERQSFKAMARFGQQKLRALLMITVGGASQPK